MTGYQPIRDLYFLALFLFLPPPLQFISWYWDIVSVTLAKSGAGMFWFTFGTPFLVYTGLYAYTFYYATRYLVHVESTSHPIGFLN